MPGRNGGTLIAGKGHGPKKGAPNAGRPPDAFKEMCRGLASSGDVEKAVRRVVKNPKHPAFIGALKWASEHGYGRPEQGVDLKSGGKTLAELITASWDRPKSAKSDG